MSKITTKRPDRTKQVLAAMLRENTGRALCDSGGTPKYVDGKYVGSDSGYGRNFERNQNRDLNAAPAVNYKPYYLKANDGRDVFGFDISLNVYHWLAERLTFDAKLNARYQRFAKKRRENDHELNIMQEFPAKLTASGLYGEPAKSFSAVNTYNGEDALSQTLQYVYFEFEGTPYVLLQIHGGADVRGGYTNAKVFAVNSEEAIFDNARVTLYAERPPEDKNQTKFEFAEGEHDVDQVIWESENAGYSFRLEVGYELWDRNVHGRVPELGGSNGFPFSKDLSQRGKGVVVIDPETERCIARSRGGNFTPNHKTHLLIDLSGPRVAGLMSFMIR